MDSCSDDTGRTVMAKRSDNILLLALSEKEAATLRNIVDIPLTEGGGRGRVVFFVAVVLLLAGCLAFGLLRPERVRAIVESVMLLVR